MANSQFAIRLATHRILWLSRPSWGIAGGAGDGARDDRVCLEDA